MSAGEFERGMPPAFHLAEAIKLESKAVNDQHLSPRVYSSDNAELHYRKRSDGTICLTSKSGN